MKLYILALLIVLPLIYAQAPFAFYTLSMSPSGNSVKVYSGAATGMITYVTEVPTGGNGAGVESQQSIYVKENYLFAVNPASNTVSLFSINPNDPTNITLLGTPQNSGGTFPNSVTAYGGYAAVVNTGDQNGMRVFTYGPTGLTPVANSDRNFSLILTNPPVSHTGPAQIAFTPDGSGLVISNKNATPPLYYFTVSNGMPSASPATTPDLGMVPFGFTFTGTGDVVLTDAAPTGTDSGLMIAHPTNSPQNITYSIPAYYIIDGQRASCWVSWSKATDHFYVANAASGNVTEVSLSGTTFSVVNNYPVPGPTDSVVATINGADYLYQLSTKNASVFVFSLASTGANWIQSAAIPAFSGGAGTAVWVSQAATTTTAAATTGAATSSAASTSSSASTSSGASTSGASTTSASTTSGASTTSAASTTSGTTTGAATTSATTTAATTSATTAAATTSGASTTSGTTAAASTSAKASTATSTSATSAKVTTTSDGSAVRVGLWVLAIVMGVIMM